MESDDRHAFFLGVLQEVRDILTPRFPKGYAPKKQTPESMNEILDTFENLELEEPSEKLEQTPNVATAPMDAGAADANYKAEQPNSLNEDFLAFYLLLGDLNKLRTEVRRTWEAYKQGLIDLVAASITTKTAVDLARALEEDLKDQLAKYGGAGNMLTIFYNAQCEQAGTKESHKERPDDEFNFKMYDVANAIFWPAFLLLSSFCPVIKACCLPEMKPGFFGTYDPSSSRDKKTRREQFQEDKIILFEILPEFMVLCKCTEYAPAEDEFTRGLRNTFETKKVTLWLAFATTLFLDIHHTLRYEVDFCFKKLADTATFVTNNIKNTLEFHKDLRIENWPAENDQVMVAFSNEIRHWIIEDPHRKAAKQLKRINIPRPYHLFRNHPWSCGLWKYWIQIQFQDTALAFVNAWGSVMYCAHLYNAVQQEKFLTKPWSDMDLCFAIQGPEPFFVGEPPSNPEDYLKHFAMALGVSATNFGTKANRKKKGIFASKRGPKSLKDLAPVLTTFKERYCDRNPRFELRTEDVEKILEKSDWQYEMNNEDKPMTLIKDNEKVPGLQKAVAKQLPATKLLVTLRATLQAEILELSFDYLTLHRFCWRLLRAVKDRCRDRLIEMYGPEYIEKENQLPFIVGYIFMTATNTKRLADFMKMKKTDEVTGVMLSQAADAIKGMLDAGTGDIVGTILRERLGIPFEFQGDDE